MECGVPEPAHTLPDLTPLGIFDHSGLTVTLLSWSSKPGIAKDCFFPVGIFPSQGLERVKFGQTCILLFQHDHLHF